MLENVRHAGKSDIGLLRHNNEDSFLFVDQSCKQYDWRRLGLLFVVADGLGGHAAGEIASQMACEETIAQYYTQNVPLPHQADDYKWKLNRLEQTVWSVHKKIIHRAARDEKLRGMGTTLSALLLTDDYALIAHVGDSRIYRLRYDLCERITIDHVRNQLFLERTAIPKEWESNIFSRRVLTQALGGYDDLSIIFTWVEPAQPGDVFLLCTDGLHDLVTDEEITEILMKNTRPPQACDALVQAALSRGGHDNVTVLVVCL